MESSPPSRMPTPGPPPSAGLPRQAGALGLGPSVKARALPEVIGHRITPNSELCSLCRGAKSQELWLMIHFLTFLSLIFSLYWGIVALQCCVSFGRMCVYVTMRVQSHTTLRLQGLSPARLLCPWNAPGKNTGVGCHQSDSVIQLHIFILFSDSFPLQVVSF